MIMMKNENKNETKKEKKNRSKYSTVFYQLTDFPLSCHFSVQSFHFIFI